jgi:xanthine dehydrogenase YagT iron-sulfur-binding subunit
MASDEQGNDLKTSLGRITRRSFLSRAGAATAAGAISPLVPAPASAAVAPATPVPDTIPGTIAVTLRVNGKSCSVQVDPRATLLDTLRETLHLTGTKKGCDHGQCGACTVHADGRRINSCLTLAAMQQNVDITTIEGLGTPDSLHPMQNAFVEHDAFQCGYCTSGQIMSAVAMLKEPWGQSDPEVREALSGNICRCGAYPNIVAAVQSVRSTS